MRELKKAMEQHNVTAIEVEEMCDIVSELLKAYAEDTRVTEPSAFNTIRKNEAASEVVSWLGNMIVMVLDEDEIDDEDSDEWHDDSNRGCKDCSDDECTGNCMSCYYRPV